ncbi:hypothetical protein LX32DRAFT_281195 [Colletotrichum zoysiae]|uniref:Uncharacterized protein n=1 Tax=Colletotrichum zoysiae TaxID=1216348 RepID=A0AAD9H247_9PEZI|nr:hypothetical protein LX32DRAFT_281195 [Colletotrichum zoysiae]
MKETTKRNQRRLLHTCQRNGGTNCAAETSPRKAMAWNDAAVSVGLAFDRLVRCYLVPSYCWLANPNPLPLDKTAAGQPQSASEICSLLVFCLCFLGSALCGLL